MPNWDEGHAPLSIGFRGLDEMQRELETLAKRAVPHAARETLNGLAFAGREIWRDEMRRTLTLRNAWTARQVRVQTARGVRMPEMEALLGHPEDYVRRLEYGIGTRARRSGVPIPSEAAAGQAKGSLAAGRKRPVKKAFITRALGKIRRQSKSLPRKARNARAVRDALRNGSRLAYLELEHRRGIYRVMGGRKNPDIRELYNLSHAFTPRPRKPLLQLTLQKALLQAPSIGLAAVQRQLDRWKIGSRAA